MIRTQSSAVINFARRAFIRGMAPMGAARARQLFREGLPENFRPAFEFLFEQKLSAQDVRVVERVEVLRTALAQGNKSFRVIGSDGNLLTRTSQFIAQYSSVTRGWGTFLYLCAKGFKATTILELGSCVGISGSYLASAPHCREFLSIERSPELAALARTHIQHICRDADVVNGTIDDVLPQVLAQFTQPIDLYYVDANHHYEPTLRYFEKAIPFLGQGALVVFDDIHWSKPMWNAWQQLCAHQGFSHTIDIGRFGLCVWQGGHAQPRRHTLARYAGWVWSYVPR